VSATHCRVSQDHPYGGAEPQTVLRARGYSRTVRKPAALGAVLVAGVLGAGMLAAPASGDVAPAVHAHAATRAPIHVGSLLLRPCSVVPGAYCGHLDRPWDSTGVVPGTVRIGFAFVPAMDPGKPLLGTVVPHEGGPGYSTTGSAQSYYDMYGPLLRQRNFLVVDQRGTGRSEPVDCPALQNLVTAYAPAAAKCGKQLGDHADLYGSADSADDVAAVIRALDLPRVDLYGDSYGTFFTQVFVGRHPDLVRSAVLDSAYPTYGEDAWYPTQGPAMLSSLDAVCARTPACAAYGVPTSTLLRRVLEQVRAHPWTGVGYDGDGIRHRVVVDGPALVGVAFGATYGPYWYRELPGALRSALRGDKQPLFRLVAEADYVSGDAGDPADYSEGLDAAVSCHDYPQLYDMTAPAAQRQRQYDAAVRAESRAHPDVYAPFTVQEYLGSVWEAQDWCLRWPVPSAGHPAGPPVPLGGHYPGVPVLVLSGELDSITTPAEGALVTAQFPQAVQVHVANSFHVTADGDTDACAVDVLRAFVRDPAHGLTPQVLACTTQVPPVRALGVFPTSYRSVPPATPETGNGVGSGGRRAAATAALTVADLLDRWWNNYDGAGVGLYGGRWSYAGDRVTTFSLHGVRLAPDLAVSGTVVWGRYSHDVTAKLTVVQVDASGRAVPGSTVSGVVTGSWDYRAAGAVATLHGTLGGQPLSATMPAP
jgi:pimeloyl-ACP methyl ester carboxylesterase